MPNLTLKLSDHAKKKHQNETWNGVTLRDAYNSGQLTDIQVIEGRTADELYAVAPDGARVLIVLSKDKGGFRVVISAYAVG